MAKLKDIGLPKNLKRKEEELEEDIFDVGMEDEFDLEEGMEEEGMEEEMAVDLTAVSDEELMEELKRRGIEGGSEPLEDELV